MTTALENFISRLWNNLLSRSANPASGSSLNLGILVADGQLTGRHLSIPPGKRTQHLAVLGKTGTGKSFLLRHIALQDVRAGRGFAFFDLHGDTTPFLLRAIASEEQRTGRDLSEKLILIEPGDPEFALGLNVLERHQGKASFAQIAEFAQVLKTRWGLDAFGARTEELLRNSLHVLSDNRLTLLELSALLTDSLFRASCLAQTTNPEVEAYFRSRYNTSSEPMQAVLREALLNKVSAFTSDPQFRSILGQQRSTFSLPRSVDQGRWLVFNLAKGRLGEQATTLGSLFLVKLKNALFARKTRQLFTVFCDEIQNLLAYDSGIDTLLSEARKFGVSVVSANQFLDQYPKNMRSAILSVGTHVFFQVSGSDADRITQILDGGKGLRRTLKNLRPRHAVVKSGHRRWQQVRVPDVNEPEADAADLRLRCNRRWSKTRAGEEREIESRRAMFDETSNEVLHDWE